MEEPSQVYMNKAVAFLTGNCLGGKLVQGANSLLCSVILYILLSWAFIGDDSLWSRFKRLETSYTALAATVTGNAQRQSMWETDGDRHFGVVDNRLASVEGKTQVLDTQVKVLDATTCKIGRKC